MKLRLWLWSVAFFALTFSPLQGMNSLVHAGPPNTIGNITVRQLPSMNTRQNFHGYREYRFELRNLSSAQTHKVQLMMLGNYVGGNWVRDISRSVVVGPNSRSVVSLFQPALNISSSEMYIAVDGGKQGGSIHLSGANHYFNHYRRRHTTLLVDRMTGANSYNCGSKMQDQATANMGTRRYNRYRFDCSHADVPVAQWSEHWLGYSRFDGVLVTAKQFVAAPVGVRSAIRRYVEAGGTLAVFGQWTPPKHWTNVAVSSNAPEQYAAGFGTALVFKSKEISSLTSVEVTQLADEVLATFKPFETRRTASEANRVLPVVDEIRIPVRGIFMLMLLFSVLIGPLNVWWLSRKKRRIMLLLTVPVVSLVMCLLVFGYALFSEGFRGHSRTASLTVLDQRTHQAATIGLKGFYMPLAPGDGFKFRSSTELTPQIRSYRYRGGGRSVSMDWSKGQSLGAGWISSRLPLHFRYRSHQNRRERLVIKPGAPGTLQVTNGLGVAIETLFVADAKGFIYKTRGPIAPGAEGILHKAKTLNYSPVGITQRTPRFLRQAYIKAWLPLLNSLVDQPERYLMANSYIAKVKKSPFVEQALPVLQSNRHNSVILGYFKGGNHGS